MINHTLILRYDIKRLNTFLFVHFNKQKKTENSLMR
jgi:hypothetical protein